MAPIRTWTTTSYSSAWTPAVVGSIVSRHSGTPLTTERIPRADEFGPS